MNPSRRLLATAALLLTSTLAWAGGRSEEGWSLELTGGWGGMDSIEGRVTESVHGSPSSTGVNVDLSELGLRDDYSTHTFGLKAYNRWFTFLLDYRSSSIEASGTASQDFRFEVDSISFGGRTFEFQVIPEGVDYDLKANADWLGLGARFTPIILNEGGVVQFTPWVHLGIQAVSVEYDIDAGGAIGVTSNGSELRSYVQRGNSQASGEAGLPEYGIGGELRILFHEPGERGIELYGDMTYKILDFQGALGDLGVDDDKFEEIDFSYSALEAGIYLQVPLRGNVDFLAGLYLERVEIESQLDANESKGEVLDREADLSYTIYALKAGLLF